MKKTNRAATKDSGSPVEPQVEIAIKPPPHSAKVAWSPTVAFTEAELTLLRFFGRRILGPDADDQCYAVFFKKIALLNWKFLIDQTYYQQKHAEDEGWRLTASALNHLLDTEAYGSTL